MNLLVRNMKLTPSKNKAKFAETERGFTGNREDLPKETGFPKYRDNDIK